VSPGVGREGRVFFVLERTRGSSWLASSQGRRRRSLPKSVPSTGRCSLIEKLRRRDERNGEALKGKKGSYTGGILSLGYSFRRKGR